MEVLIFGIFLLFVGSVWALSRNEEPRDYPSEQVSKPSQEERPKLSAPTPLGDKAEREAQPEKIPYTPPTTPAKKREFHHEGVVRREVNDSGGESIIYQRRITVTETVVSAAEPLVGRAWVVDGDTIVIQNTNIRLYGIDAPEMEHPYGAKSKWAMVALCKGQVITAIPDGSSSYERCVARCFLPDGRDLSAELVKQGLALDWPKFSGGEYAKFEPEGVRKKLWRAHNRQIGKYIPPVKKST